MKKKNPNENGKMPTIKDYPPPKHLTPEQKELLEATREYVKALDNRIKKHGPPPDFRH